MGSTRTTTWNVRGLNGKEMELEWELGKRKLDVAIITDEDKITGFQIHFRIYFDKP